MANEWKINLAKFDGKTSLLLECLRYAGIVGNVDHKYKDDEDAEGYFNFCVYAPKDIDEEAWADMNMKRMRSFGINAKSEMI